VKTSTYRIGKPSFKVGTIRARDYFELYAKKDPLRLNTYYALQHVALPNEDIKNPPYLPLIHRGPYAWYGPEGHYEPNHSQFKTVRI
jgi:hypothetical protein